MTFIFLTIYIFFSFYLNGLICTVIQRIFFHPCDPPSIQTWTSQFLFFRFLTIIFFVIYALPKLFLK